MSEKKIPVVCALDIISHFAILEIENTEANRAIISAWVDGYCYGLMRGDFIDIEALEKVRLFVSNFRNYEKWDLLLEDIIETLGGTDPNDKIIKFLHKGEKTKEGDSKDEANEK